MNGKGVSEGPDRRQLLAHILPAGAFACLFCRHAFAAMASQATNAAGQVKPKSQEPCGMTYEELFKFAYADGMIPLMKEMADDVGREKFLDMLKKAASAAAIQGTREALKKNPQNDFATFAADVRRSNPLYDHTLTSQIVEDTPTAIALRITGCLWAKTFRDADAADIGYVSMCYPDLAAAPFYNPKIKLTVTKTLMQGHDCCDFRWTLES